MPKLVAVALVVVGFGDVLTSVEMSVMVSIVAF